MLHKKDSRVQHSQRLHINQQYVGTVTLSKQCSANSVNYLKLIIESIKKNNIVDILKRSQ